MRVTTQMTNEVAAKTKIAVNQNSLLNLGNTTENSLLEELNKTSEEKVSTVMSGDYNKTAKNADALAQVAELFLETKDGSLLSRLTTEEGKKEAANKLNQLVEKYNATLSSLKKTGNELDVYYAQMMKALVEENEEGLAALGVSCDAGGKLTFNADAFQKADADTVKSVLGKDSDFMQKLAFIADHIADNARANAKSFISRYNAAGMAQTQPAGAYRFDSKS